jgi:hypothetical protein
MKRTDVWDSSEGTPAIPEGQEVSVAEAGAAMFAAAAKALPGVKQVVRRDKAYRPEPSFLVYVQTGELETQRKVYDAELSVYQKFADLYLDINIEEIASENSAAVSSAS